MSIEERIKAKQADIMATLAGADDNKIKLASDLIKQAAFMAVTLEDLADVISAEGVTEEYTNGKNQSGRKTSSNAKLYASLISKYDVIVSKLLKLVPKEIKSVKTDIAAEEAKAKAEEKRIREIERSEQCSADFMEAIRAGTASYEHFTDFCEEWERQHAV